MKYTTRWVLSIAIVLLTATSIFFKDLIMFTVTAYPLIIGWVIGELLNIPERLLKNKWRHLKDKMIIFLFNSLNKEKVEVDKSNGEDREYHS
ncbi:hypothetical protein [Enterococcus rotai]|uniref:hypothetical protein n=1 Tax=Enterococcus rotai TaxID=118060 RepID=UPI0032B58981